MINTQNRSFGQNINTWVQTMALLLAAGLGIYTFWYKDVLLPKSAPVNITMSLDLERIGDLWSADQTTQLVAVQMRVTARNPSPREVFLLRSAWIAHGVSIVMATDTSTFDYGVETYNSGTPYLSVQRHMQANNWSLVAFGDLFVDSFLKPDETISRTMLIYVPRDQFDLLEVYVSMPTVGQSGVVELEWRLDDTQWIVPTIYHLGANGERIGEMERDEYGGYTNAELELQMAASMSSLSLW